MHKDLTVEAPRPEAAAGPQGPERSASDAAAIEAGLHTLRDMPPNTPLAELAQSLLTLPATPGERLEIEALALIVNSLNGSAQIHADLLRARDLLARSIELGADMAEAAAWRALQWLQRQLRLHHAALHSLAKARALYERCGEPALALRMDTSRLSLFFAAEMFVELRQACHEMLAQHRTSLPPRLRDTLLCNAASASYYLATDETDPQRAAALWDECMGYHQAALDHAIAQQIPTSLIHLNMAVASATLGRIEACQTLLAGIDGALLDASLPAEWRCWLQYIDAVLACHRHNTPQAWQQLLDLAEQLGGPSLNTSGQLQATLKAIVRMGALNGHWQDALNAQQRLLKLQVRLRRELAATFDHVVQDLMAQPHLEHQNTLLTQHGTALEQSLAERNAELSSTLARLQSEMSIRQAAEMALQQSHDDLELQVQQRSAELNQALQTLMHKEKQLALSRLVSGVAHEMNTPLDNARMAASTLANHSAAVKVAVLGEHLRRSQLVSWLDAVGQAGELIDSALNRMGQLVQRFKTLANQHVGEAPQSLDLGQFLGLQARAWHTRLQACQVQLLLDLPEQSLLTAYPNALQQVLQQLLDNSLTHGLSGKDDGCIRVQLRLHPDTFTLSWQDNGRGIAPEHLPHVFEPFFTPQLGQSGTGLGLASVHSMVVELMRGQVLIDSTLGQGTTVSLCLPRQPGA